MVTRSQTLRLAYFSAILICSMPLLIGLIGTLAPAFSWLPILDLHQPSLASWRHLFHEPVLWRSISLTIFITLCSTALTLLFSFTLLMRFYNSKYWSWITGTLSPIFALPHVAFAIGFTFLLSPSGWIFRLLHPIFNISQAHAWILVNDTHGLGMSLALAIKETPFLLLMSIAPLQQLNINQLLTVGTSLGYQPKQVWYKIIMPLWLSYLRLPIAAIIGYSLSVVDFSLILAPLRPAPFAVQIWQWIKEPNLAMLPVAAAASLLLLVLALIILGGLRYTEYLLMKKCNTWQFNGQRQSGYWGKLISTITPLFYGVMILLPLLSVFMLALWSFSFRWRFPDILPQSWTLKFWMSQWENLHSLFATSMSIALLSTFISLLFSIICLEYKQKNHKGLPLIFLVIPLVVPQVGLLFGVQIITLYFPYLDPFSTVVWGHILFVFPYVYLSLAPAWQAFDQRYLQVATSLGTPPLKAWFLVKLPLLKNGLIFAIIVGMGVSLTQYLPTLILGSGRIATITTEAVAITSGQDRRIMAIYGLMQALLPFILILSSFHYSQRVHKR